jgi:uncharacterized membrane protein YccC
MLSEPRSQQKRITEMHQFVVSNHMLTSHIATLAYYAEPYAVRFAGPAYEPVVDDIGYRLQRTVDLLEDKPMPPARTAGKEGLRLLNEQADTGEIRSIAEQFNFIAKVTTDLGKVSEPLHEAFT